MAETEEDYSRASSWIELSTRSRSSYCSRVRHYIVCLDFQLILDVFFVLNSNLTSKNVLLTDQWNTKIAGMLCC